MEQALSPLDSTVTIFPNITKSREPHHRAVRDIFERIRSGKSKDLIERIREQQDKKERNELKKQLPSICFSGTFKHRDNQGILDHSGLICLDFDHLESKEKLLAFKTKLTNSKYVFAVFVSPSGDGLKVVVRIPREIDNHAKYAASLSKWFYQDEQKVDEFKDIARVCYESFDPDIYVNEQAAIYDIITKPKPVVIEFTADDVIKDEQVIFRNLKKWADARNSYHDGNKYKFLVMFAGACNRFGLKPDLVANKLIESYQDKASWVDSKDFYDIVKRIYITYEHENGISKWSAKEGMMDFDPHDRARDVIYLDDIRTDMLNSFFKGDSRGETTFFNSIDRHWSWKRGEVTLMHGPPNHGKSILTLQMMLLKSIHEGVKWGIFSPEQNPPIDFYKDLIHMYVGKSTESWHKHRMDEKEFNNGMDFMREYFYFLYPKNDSPTPQYINDRFSELIIKEKISGCLIDPFNQLDNDWASAGGRDDQYISSFGAKEKRFALTNNVYKIIIAHPKGGLDKLTDKNQDPELKNAGNYRCPDIYDIAGGAMWGNKMDNIICTYQPFYQTRAMNSNRTSDVTDHGRHLRMTQFRSQKIKKPKLIGLPGTANLIFNIKQFRYYEEQGYRERTEHSDEVMRGLPDDGVYCPFDKEYKERSIKATLEETVSATHWEKFIEQDKRKSEVEREQEQRDKEDNTMLELGLDPTVDEMPYDIDSSSYDNEFDGPFEAEDEGL